MTQTEIEVELKDHENEIKSLKHRMDKAEENDKVLTKILLSVKELATNMSHMATEQAKQGDRLERLEREPEDNHRFIKQTVISVVISGGLGTALGILITHLMGGV